MTDRVKRLKKLLTLQEQLKAMHELRLTREDTNRKYASSEAAKVATAAARTNMVERTYREARVADERERGDKERLEIIAQRLKPGK